MPDNDKLREYLKRVTADLRKARSRLRAVEERRHEPIAIVGMSCRYPGGVRSPEELWRLVAGGNDAVSSFPEDRGWDLDALYPAETEGDGAGGTREGGFLYDAGDFDPEFFGISPREALAMDPQQRLFLESCWEALEHAGIDPASLRGGRTGVFAGAMHQSYGVSSGPIPENVDAYLATGISTSVLSGRVAYTFGFEGPAVTVDTSCSSSLVTMHLACGALRAGECSLALAGGATVMASPRVFQDFSSQRGLAGDGRCKSFADCADGAGFSEGVGVVLLERLSDAQLSGRRILAVVRGSAVNQDGASNGLTAPNGPSQERVIRQALANARLSVADVDAVEGHGTGTTLGDPIEARALLATYGSDRRAGRPLWLGSIKSNMGHTQAAAGVAGVIKMVKAMEHGALPRTLHVDEPSRHVDWSTGSVSLLVRETPWERNGEPRRAAVSSFGISGTNAHVILEEAPPEPLVSGGAEGEGEDSGVVGAERVGEGSGSVGGERVDEGMGVVGEGLGSVGGERVGEGLGTVGREGVGEDSGPVRVGSTSTDSGVLDAQDVVDGSLVGGIEGFALGSVMLPVVPLIVSGRGEGARRDQAERLRGFLVAEQAVGLSDVGLSLACGRARFGERAVVIGGDRGELVAGLGALAGGVGVNGVVRGSVDGGELAFMFTGQGSQRIGMGRELYDRFGVFREAFDRICGELDGYLGCSLRELVFGGSDPGASGSLEDTMFAQPALFALEAALFRLLESWGVRPDYLVGHSVGEVVAAHVAGVFSLEDACALVAARGGLMGRLPAGGAMASVGCSETELLETLEEFEGRVVLAAVNGPSSVVLSGDEDAVLELVGHWRELGRKTKRLRVSHAFHSRRMDGMLDEFADVLGGLKFAPPTIPIVSNLTGEEVSESEIRAREYWVRHVREPVRFMDGVRWLSDRGVTRFLELGPDGVLSGMGRECLEHWPAREGDGNGSPAGFAAALRGERPETGAIFTALGEMWVRGVEVGWERVFAGTGARRVGLPTYAFQRRRFWLGGSGGGSGDVRSAGLGPIRHRLLGAVVGLADGEGWLFTGRISLKDDAWLADHAVMGTVLFPGAGLLDLVLSAGRELGCSSVRELVLEAPLVLSERDFVRLQLTVGEPNEDGVRAVGVFSQAEGALAGIEDGLGLKDAWTRHATGLLAADDLDLETVGGLDGLDGAWPPTGAIDIEADDVYGRLADMGLDYGPVFQGLQRAWRRGEDVFCEVALPEEQHGNARAFGLHPALLDAVMHAAVAIEEADPEEMVGVRLPFSWNGVSLGAAGASRLRARLSPGREGALSVLAVEETGELALAVGSLVTRRIAAEQLRAARDTQRDHLFAVRWAPLAARQEYEREIDGTEDWALIGPEDSETAHSLGAAGAGVRVYEDLRTLRGATGDDERVPRVVLMDMRALICRDDRANANDLVKSTQALEDEAAAEDLSERVRDGVCGVLSLLQKWVSDERLSGSSLVLLGGDRTARYDGGLRDAEGLVESSVRGLLRSACSEHPGRFVWAELDGQPASWSALRGALDRGEPELIVREGEISVPRLARVPVKPTSDVTEQTTLSNPVWDPMGTVLITGGTGGLGSAIARHLVEKHGVGSLMLTSRGGLQAHGAVELRDELESLGAQVRVTACDVSDRDALAGLLDAVPEEFPLRGVVHAAGTLDDGVIDSLTPARVERVLAPKASAAWHLHELTRALDLGAFVLFSSAAATIGSPGQGSYAAANAFLDGLAAYRRARGLSGSAIAWGLWEQVGGMTAALGESDIARIERTGMLALSTEEGLGMFDLAREADEAMVVAMRMDSVTMRAQARKGLLPPLMAGLVHVPARRRARGGSLALILAGAPEGEREGLALEAVRGEVAVVLGHSSTDEVDPERAFKDLGFDSLAAVELRNRLNALTGYSLPATLVFDYPNARALARHLLKELAGVDQRRSLRTNRAVGAADEQVAIVGMSCRYPGGVRSPQDLWRLVADGGDGIGGFPADRGWGLEELFDPDPEHPGTSYVQEGGFLYDAAEFDSSFFGISPREAITMDPQQRLLLEASWEAFEDAGLDPGALRGSSTGVFAGLMYHDYAAGIRTVPPELQGYVGTGLSGSVLSGRVAYVFGLEGPAVTVDTACSSSLVAMHWACQSLRSGDCSLALAGGVTVLSSPTVFVEFSRQRNLARDGRCKSFADTADGVGFSEGVGVVLLERLSDAHRNGHRVLAVVRGSAVNQDGASNGLTAPNGPSQERVIEQALANARLSPGDVDAVEGHGTGTTLGDPIEAQALLATYGRDRPAERPLWLGSVKSNIGHTQAAAGVAGVIKMVKAIEHGVFPRTLHIEQPSRHVDWSAGAISLLTEEAAWLAGERPRRAGVSSFGISGTNAHVILEEPPPPAAEREQLVTEEDDHAQDVRELPVLPLILSGRGEQALRGQAARLGELLADRSEPAAGDVCLSSTLGRARFSHRAVVLGGNREELLRGVRALSGATDMSGVIGGSVSAGETAFMFTGQGSQRVGMGRELHDVFRVFRESFDEVCRELEPLLDRSLRDLVFGSGVSAGSGMLDETQFAQPALFAIEVALFRLLEDWGVRAEYLMGHSVGEVVAAHVAGVLSLEDACTLVAARGRLMGQLPAGGAMASVGACEEEVLASLAGLEDRVVLAAVNGPRSVVVSGDEDAVLEVVTGWRERGVKTKRLRVSHAFHSQRMDGMLEELSEIVGGLSFSAAATTIVSNLTGEPVSSDQMCRAEYWARHVREPVRFMDGVRWLAANGVTRFLELGPDSVLSAMGRESLEVHSDDGEGEVHTMSWVSVSRENRPEVATLMGALGELWVHGAEVNWKAMLDGYGFERVKLPSYAFQRERFWLDSGVGVGDARSVGLVSAEHPLLDAVLTLAGGEGWVFTARLSADGESWLTDHAVMGATLFPATGLLELVLHAGREVGCRVVRELVLEAPLVLPEKGAVQLQVAIGEGDGDGNRTVSVFSRLDESSSRFDGTSGLETPWTRHASGTLEQEGKSGHDHFDIAGGEWPPAGAVEIEVGDLYERLADLGLEYGPAFQGLKSVWQRGDDLFCEVSLPQAELARAESFGLHPALFDAALHAAVLAGGTDAQASETHGLRLPFSWREVRLGMLGSSSVRVCISEKPATGTADAGDDRGLSLTAVDRDGALVVSVGSLLAREVSTEQLHAAVGARRESLFNLEWVPVSPGQPEHDAAARGWVVLGADGSPLVDALGETGVVTAYADLQAFAQALSNDEASSLGELVLLDTHALRVPEGDKHGHGGGTKHGHGGGASSESDVGDGGQDAVAVEAELGGAGGEAFDQDLPERAQTAVCGVLSTVQEWVSDERFARSRLVVLTEGAVRARSGDGVLGIVDSGVWGLLRSAQSEHPGRFVIVDIDGRRSSVEALGSALASDEPQLAVRDGEVFAPRLARLTEHMPADETGEVNGDGNSPDPGLGAACSVLITGGTGGLGATVARHLVAQHGVGCMVLVSRRGLAAPGAVELQAELVELGAVVQVHACDASDRGALADVLGQVPAEFPLRGVVHTAGVLDDGVIGSLTDERVGNVFAPKARGAWHLHELTRGLDLEMFVLFSSAAGTLGAPGQANYAAANAFLDALADHRRSGGMPATSIAWGLWEQASEMTDELKEVDRVRMARSGILGLSSGEGLELFDLARQSAEASLLAARFDNSALRAAVRAGGLPALMSNLVRVPVRRGGDGRSLMRRLVDVPELDREATVLELVRGEVAIVLGHASAGSVEPDRAFKDLGFDSLAAVELRNRLNVIAGLDLPATLVFDYPNATLLARHLLERVEPGASAAGAPADVELDRLELALSSMASGEADRARISSRLRALLSQLDNAERSGDHVSVTERIQSASADEVFEFIDNEFESS